MKKLALLGMLPGAVFAQSTGLTVGDTKIQMREADTPEAHAETTIKLEAYIQGAIDAVYSIATGSASGAVGFGLGAAGLGALASRVSSMVSDTANCSKESPASDILSLALEAPDERDDELLATFALKSAMSNCLKFPGQE